MKANVTPLTLLLDGTKQFRTPIYQRNYTWNTNECESLWNDILSDKRLHHIGAISYKKQGQTFSGQVQCNLLIDGQQRITTISLLFKSIVNFLEKNTDIENSKERSEQINETYLINRHGKNDMKNKLFLNEKDNEVYTKLLNNNHDSVDKNSRIYKNYKFFSERITHENINQILSGFEKLNVIEAIIEDDDDPQQIFESLNSTGVDLTQSDLVKNFIFMSLSDDQQREIYDFWSTMEDSHSEDSNSLTSFIRKYIECKKLSSTRENEVYSDFKSYFNSLDCSKKTLLKELALFSNYHNYIFKHQEDNSKLSIIFSDFSRLKIGYTEPILLFLYHDHKTGILQEDDLHNILVFLRSYLIRRNISISASRDMEPMFFNIMRKIKEDKNNEEFSSTDYKNRVLAELILQKDIKKFPDDREFKDSLLTKDIYNSKHKNFLFEKIENYDRKKEKISSLDKTWTIEHIIPQSEDIPEDWKLELGENFEIVKSKYLHTIGNLTITDYNSEMSNYSFKEKKRIGFDSSRYHMNDFVRSQNNWNEQTILKRVNEYFYPKLIEIFPYPVIQPEVLKKFKDERSKYKIEKYEYYEDHKFLYETLLLKLRNEGISIEEKINASNIEFNQNFWLKFQKKEMKLYIEKTNSIIKTLDNIQKSDLDWIIKDNEIVISFNDEKNIPSIIKVISDLQ